MNITGKQSSILPLDSVAVIVADCYFLESEIFVSQWKYDVTDFTASKYELLFEKHGLTKETFLQNMRFYFTHKKYSDIISKRIDVIVEQRVAALRDSLVLE